MNRNSFGIQNHMLLELEINFVGKQLVFSHKSTLYRLTVKRFNFRKSSQFTQIGTMNWTITSPKHLFLFSENDLDMSQGMIWNRDVVLLRQKKSAPKHLNILLRLTKLIRWNHSSFCHLESALINSWELFFHFPLTVNGVRCLFWEFPSETYRWNMQNVCMYAAKYFIKHGKFRHLAYMYFECLHCSSKSLFKMSR